MLFETIRVRHSDFPKMGTAFGKHDRVSYHRSNSNGDAQSVHSSRYIRHTFLGMPAPSGEAESLWGPLNLTAFLYPSDTRKFKRRAGWKKDLLHNLSMTLAGTGAKPTGIGVDLHELMTSKHRHSDWMKVDSAVKLSAAVLNDPASAVMYKEDKASRIGTFQILAPSDVARQLAAFGYAKVNSWNLDMVALANQANAAISTKKAAPVVRAVNPPLRALAPLMNNRSLVQALRWYLGGAVRYDGHVVLKLDQGLSSKNYISSLWHHDSCGRRIKLFIFLHDVHSHSRPTLIAERSHNTWYHMHGGPPRATSRFTSKFVTSHYDVAMMTGPRGGGFIFDTNALHRGETLGNTTRTVIVLEFHVHGKIDHLARYGFDGPCPSLPSASNFGGEPGFKMYPQQRFDALALRRLLNSSCAGGIPSKALPKGMECVWQPAPQVCWKGGMRKVCVPVEIMPVSDPRLNTEKKAPKKGRRGISAGIEGGSSFVGERVLYKPDVLSPNFFMRFPSVGRFTLSCPGGDGVMSTHVVLCRPEGNGSSSIGYPGYHSMRLRYM